MRGRTRGATVPCVTAADTSIPNHLDLLYPTLQALKDLGGSARIDELMDRVVEREAFTDEQVAVRRSPEHHMGLLEYRLAWARNYLKNIGAVKNSARGVWSINPLGEELSDDSVRELVKIWKADYNRAYYEKKKLASIEEPSSEGDAEVATEAGVEAEVGWKELLLGKLLTIPTDAFERLAQRLLKEAGFRNVTVTGQSADGGIDGVGVYRLSLVSFPLFFQCKRYKGSVSSPAVRDFRGAMSGRGEKGLLITTGVFTKDARAEATRDGAPPVELIDGDELCDLLKEYELGVNTRKREVEEIEISDGFFSDL